jgi:hypothetical protein
MTAKTFLGTLEVRIGEYQNSVRQLIVANSPASAHQVLQDATAHYYGDGKAPEEDGGFYANGGEVHVSAKLLRPIGLATFLDLQRLLPVRCADNVVAPSSDALDVKVQSAATALRSALESCGVEVGQSPMLNALAASWGEKNWQVLKAKVATPDRAAMKRLIAAAQAVVDQADDSGCSDDLTVTSSEAVQLLSNLLDSQDA